MAQKIGSSNKHFSDYMISYDIFQPEQAVSVNEPEEYFLP